MPINNKKQQFPASRWKTERSPTRQSSLFILAPIHNSHLILLLSAAGAAVVMAPPPPTYIRSILGVPDTVPSVTDSVLVIIDAQNE